MTKTKQSAKNVKASKSKMYKGLFFDPSSKEAKKFRGKRRTKLFSLINAILMHGEIKKNPKELKKSIKEFNANYKEHYILNDFSIESFFKGSNAKQEDLKRCLKIITKSLAQKNAPKKEKKEEVQK